VKKIIAMPGAASRAADLLLKKQFKKQGSPGIKIQNFLKPPNASRFIFYQQITGHQSQ